MSNANTDSITWINELVAGNNDVMDEFWGRYGASLERVARSRMTPALQRWVGPEDVVQSACRSFLRRAQQGEYELSESESLWRLLFAITLMRVRQHARFHYRKRRRLDREIALDAACEPREPVIQNIAVSMQPKPAEAAEFADQLQHILDALGEEERRLAQLKLDGIPPEEIAAQMECSERTVRRLSQRVREQWERELRDSLGD